MAVLILYNRVIKRTVMTKKKREKTEKADVKRRQNIEVYFIGVGQIL